jgi:peptidoglycan/LPS O-acetylase OafA/YrhL
MDFRTGVMQQSDRAGFGLSGGAGFSGSEMVGIPGVKPLLAESVAGEAGGAPALIPHADTRSLGLDLVRAAAILMVLVDHWSSSFLGWAGRPPIRALAYAGNFGVELFFGLSGFLIGSILLKQAARDPSARNLRVFLVRRWMRTLPLYFLILAVLALLFPPAQHLPGYLLRYATFTQNAITPLPPGWWYPVSWSLAVEEWFYLLFGSATFLAFRLLPGRSAVWWPLAAFLSVPFALRLLVPAYLAPSGVWSLVVAFRLDDIAYGVILAVLHQRRAGLFRRPLACLAIGLVLIAMAWTKSVPGPHLLVHALAFNVLGWGCVLILPAALRLRALPHPLARLVRLVSAQSYGLYLIHIVFVTDIAQALFLQHRGPAWLCMAIAMIPPFILAGLSFRFFEAPILKRRPTHGGRAEAADPAPTVREAAA